MNQIDDLDIESYDTINEFVIAGEFGFLRVLGPFECEKEGTLWTIIVPLNENETVVRNNFTVNSLTGTEGESAVIIADGKAVGGGIIKLINKPHGGDKLHIVVDQYAMG